MHSNHLTRHAEQVLTVTQGKTPHQYGPGADPSIARSWLRCLEDYHLDPAQAMAPTVLEHARVLESREQLQQVLTIAGDEMNSLHRQLAGGSAVLLTDARGIILNCVTESGDRRIFERAGLWLGAD
jgi:transcriptional regulator of acetoin/glycerol metabolism